MGDPRFAKLAKNLVEYSTRVQPGEKVLIASGDGEEKLTRELVKAVYEAGGLPFVEFRHNRVQRELLKGITVEQLELMRQRDQAFMEQMDAYIGIAYGDNASELSGIPQDKMALFGQHYAKPVHSDVRVPKTKWVVLKAPSAAFAQQAGLSTEDFEEFYFNVCGMDYEKMSRAMEPLRELMLLTDRVHIKGPGTDLTFSIKDIGVIKAEGRRNIPDGECFTAPVRDSVNGVIQYNAVSSYRGVDFDNVRFVFKDGKIVEATANHTDKLNEILDTDEGSRYIGEFAIAFNPYILHPMKDILFDEKIAGSIHFTPGACYDEASNGNKSTIHWDMVMRQDPEVGGGELWFDDRLVRKDGKFTLPELAGLNPEV